MIITIPTHKRGKDGRLYGFLMCCGDYTELHERAELLSISKQMFDPNFTFTVWLLSGDYQFQGNATLRGAYWLSDRQHDAARRKLCAVAWYGPKTKRWELYECGQFASPNGVLASRAKHTPILSGIEGVGVDIPPDPELAKFNYDQWQIDPARQRLLDSINQWLVDSKDSSHE